MTQRTRYRKFLIYIAVYVAITFLIIEVLFFAVWCRPFSDYWNPTGLSKVQCYRYPAHLILTMIFNITSDLAMLCIPIPLLLRARLPLRAKILPLYVFLLAVFVIGADIVGRVYALTDRTQRTWPIWYHREATVAVTIANMPHCGLLCRWVLGRVERVWNHRSVVPPMVVEKIRGRRRNLKRRARAQDKGDRTWFCGAGGAEEGGLGRRSDDGYIIEMASVPEEGRLSREPLQITKKVEFTICEERIDRGRGRVCPGNWRTGGGSKGGAMVEKSGVQGISTDGAEATLDWKTAV
ncbi:MAG: hypothetical protein Q9227_004772 [Pyrenula ochraceoflavens]